jgi:hypothetical protein
MTKAFVETTILTDVLLKPKSAKWTRARAALARYDRTLLPVYSIKEWKAGPLNTFAFVHDKLVSTRSLHQTLDALSILRGYKLSTAFEALTAAHAPRPGPHTVVAGSTEDQRSADRVRLALRSLIIRSWRNRRKVTTDVIQDLPCYTEAEPRIGKYGLFVLAPMKCEEQTECSLASALKARPDLLEALRNAIPANSIRLEDRNRRKALKSLIHRPKDRLDRDNCRALGDAVFAFFCPNDAVILTTNIKDHSQLAQAIGKTAKSPTDEA